jgi:hypothetical protein
MAPSISKKLVLTSPTRDIRSVGIVRSWTQYTDLVIFMNHPVIQRRMIQRL